MAHTATMVALQLLHLCLLLPNVLIPQLRMQDPASLLPMAFLVADIAIKWLIFLWKFVWAEVLDVTPFPTKTAEVRLPIPIRVNNSCLVIGRDGHLVVASISSLAMALLVITVSHNTSDGRLVVASIASLVVALVVINVSHNTSDGRLVVVTITTLLYSCKMNRRLLHVLKSIALQLLQLISLDGAKNMKHLLIRVLGNPESSLMLAQSSNANEILHVLCQDVVQESFVSEPKIQLLRLLFSLINCYRYVRSASNSMGLETYQDRIYPFVD
jgi:hypothetical protein